MSDGRLVFGDDGSIAADVAWLWVNSHPWPGWTISVVTAQQHQEFAILPPERTELHTWEPTHPRELISTDQGITVEHLTAEADPRVVLDSADEADLMVVGPRGRGALKQLHIGSTTEWLLVRPEPPVAIIRHGRATRRVLLCADGSPHAVRAATTLARMPWITSCEVTVLAVDDGATDVDEALDSVADKLRAARVEPRLSTADTKHHSHRDVRGVVLGEITALDADLVALGTRGTRTLRRAFIGSTASAVALHAPCSVLVAYDTSGEEPDAHEGAAGSGEPR